MAANAPVPASGTINPGSQARPFEAAPRAAAAPVAPVTSESLPNSLDGIATGAPVATTPDGPASAAPIYGNGMTNDPITWNPSYSGRTTDMPRPPASAMPAENVSVFYSGPGPAPIGPQVLGPTLGASAAPAGTPVMLAPQSAGTSMMAAPTAASYASQYPVADGFGQDLPLVMAIRQIVPAHYGFVFDQGIDISGKVSWQGGQPWDVVLQSTLAPLNLQASINGNVVTITRAGGMQMTAYNDGPMVTTATMQSTTTTAMAPSPLLMQASVTSPAAAQPQPIIDDMSGAAGYYNPASAPGTTDLNATATWTAARNSSLRSILEDWSKQAGVELYWAAEYDYPIQSPVSIDGTFEDAVQTLLKGLSESKPRPLGRLHPNLPNGPAVLVIETRQNSM
ncbi:MAG: TcpQ domain-containing protein [Alphaproteobacteria bacterium]|nr:TcpQ domain-containing protein [Alphaproteobacteria bacterium]